MIALVGVLCVAAVIQYLARGRRTAGTQVAHTTATYVGWGVVALIGVIVLVLLVAASA